MGALRSFHPLRSVRLLVARRPLAYWSLVAALAGAVGLYVHRAEQRAEAGRAAWGRMVDVLVLRRRVDVGETVQPADVQSVAWPARLAPAEAMTSLPPAAVAAVPLLADEPLVASRLGVPGVGPVAALVAPGRRGLFVPLGPNLLPIEVGDPVDVLGGTDASGSAMVLARAAPVLHVHEGGAVVAVLEAEAPAVATAVLAGGAVLALSPAVPPTPRGGAPPPPGGR